MSRQSRATTPTRSASSFRASLARRLLYLLFGAISAGAVFGAAPSGDIAGGSTVQTASQDGIHAW